jgi:hypothetical protein
MDHSTVGWALQRLHPRSIELHGFARGKWQQNSSWAKTFTG